MFWEAELSRVAWDWWDSVTQSWGRLRGWWDLSSGIGGILRPDLGLVVFFFPLWGVAWPPAYLLSILACLMDALCPAYVYGYQTRLWMLANVFQGTK